MSLSAKAAPLYLCEPVLVSAAVPAREMSYSAVGRHRDVRLVSAADLICQY